MFSVARREDQCNATKRRTHFHKPKEINNDEGDIVGILHTIHLSSFGPSLWDSEKSMSKDSRTVVAVALSEGGWAPCCNYGPALKKLDLRTALQAYNIRGAWA